MKKFILLFCFIFTLPLLFCNQVEFLNQLCEKEKASFSDCIKCFCYLNNIDTSDDFEDNVTNLQKHIQYMPKKYSENKTATIGDFSLLAIQFLNIKTGIFYLITKSGRYASRELNQLNIIPFNTSEWQEISGIELIRLLQKVDEYAQERKNK